MTDRELDALVAERVMGWRKKKVRYLNTLHDPPVPGPEVEETYSPDGMAFDDLRRPKWSETGDGMLAVVEAMKKRDAVCNDCPCPDRDTDNRTPKGDGWEFSCYAGGHFGGEYHVTFKARCPETKAIASADDDFLPRAVALAALKAVGCEVEA